MATRSIAGLTALLQELELEAIPDFPSADILNRPIDIYHAYLADALHKAMGCNPQQAYDAIQQPSTAAGNSDLDIVLPRLKLPSGTPPQELATELVSKFPAPHPLFLQPFKDGIHVRFVLSPKTLPRLLLPYISDRKDDYGCPFGMRHGFIASAPQKKALIEFSSPNLGQIFRTDHLRSTILGAFVSNIYEAMGWHVVRTNYLGDWGTHIGLLGLGWMRYGSDDELKRSRDPFAYIHRLYTRMEEDLKPLLAASVPSESEEETVTILAERDATLKKLEDGDPEAVELWEKLRDISTTYYINTYRRLNLRFDDYSGESLVCRNPEAIFNVEVALRELGLSENKDGCSIIDFSKHDTSSTSSRLGTAMLRSKDGATTYFLRDVSSVLDRVEDYSFDKMIYIVGEQELHFRQVFRTIELLGHGDIAQKMQHLSFTRGPPQWHESAHQLGDILDKCEEYTVMATNLCPDKFPFPKWRTSATAMIRSKAKAMGTNSLVVQELNIKNKTHTIGLDVELLTATEGETGPSLQLVYSRLCETISGLDSGKKQRSASSLPSLVPEEASTTGERIHNHESGNTDYSSLWEAPWIELLRLMARFPSVANEAYGTLEPSTLLSYLFAVVEELTYCLDEDDGEHIAHEERGSSPALRAKIDNQYNAHLALYQSVRQVLENGMRLLNISPIR
ncbi:hypothetical protein B0T17DRAFT_586143 [Bombardia bombarda]|uniref:arginine--tRNA ligase n=1 Tax=Bombardia bombarda TaxID=252184 RepID=A0AA39XIK4_9PEZI|nr:hypothetical protein B0T17DRAFT_586143 [Bombardia bombarda]